MITLNDVKNIYKKYDVQASKRFGQNFLIDESVLTRIIKIADIDNKSVIEVGPGLGSLTNLLIKDAKDVVSYEIDNDMIKVINGEINSDNFTLIEGDFLKAELDWEGKKTVVANIPYYITSDILFKLFANSSKIDRAILMVQDEVATRLVAPLGSKNYGKLTISAKYFADIKKELVVLPESFIPAPKVKSAIISLDFKDAKYNKEFLEFVKNSFAMRRKTLFNNFKKIMSPEKAILLINNAGLKETARPQELSLEKFMELFKAL